MSRQPGGAEEEVIDLTKGSGSGSGSRASPSPSPGAGADTRVCLVQVGDPPPSVHLIISTPLCPIYLIPCPITLFSSLPYTVSHIL